MAILAGMEASQLIDALGGNAVVARELGAQPRAVWRWRERGIPARYWHRIVALAEAKHVEGVTMETIARPMWHRDRHASAA